jgi:hypothetical protein
VVTAARAGSVACPTEAREVPDPRGPTAVSRCLSPMARRGAGPGPLVFAASRYVTSHEGCVCNRIRFGTEKEPSCSQILRPFSPRAAGRQGRQGRCRWGGGGLRAAEALAVGMPLASGSDPSSPPGSFRSLPAAACGLRRPRRQAPGSAVISCPYKRIGALPPTRAEATNLLRGSVMDTRLRVVEFDGVWHSHVHRNSAAMHRVRGPTGPPDLTQVRHPVPAGGLKRSFAPSGTNT